MPGWVVRLALGEQAARTDSSQAVSSWDSVWAAGSATSREENAVSTCTVTAVICMVEVTVQHPPSPGRGW